MKKKIFFLVVNILLFTNCSILINQIPGSTTKLRNDLGMETDITNSSFVITYHLNGGENNIENPESFCSDDEYIILKDPTRKGYIFIGWYTEETFINKVEKITPSITCDISLYARWKVKEYSITYVLDGGVNNKNNPTKYTIEDENIVLFEPGKVNYQFDGWYSSTEFTEKVEIIKTNALGNLVLYAKWIAPTIPIIDFESVVNEIEIQTEIINENEIKLIAPFGYEKYLWIYDEQVIPDNTNEVIISFGRIGYHYISLIVEDYSGNQYSAIVRIRKTESFQPSDDNSSDSHDNAKTSLGITLLSLENDIPDFSISVSQNLSKLTFTASAGYRNYTWYIDESVLENENNILSLNNMTAGYHFISVLTVDNKNNKLSASCVVRVTE